MKDSISKSEAITTVRDHLSPEQNERCSEAMILRYLRATGNDPRHTIKRIQDTLAWWAAEDPTTMYCSACRNKYPHSHYMHVVGRDLVGRPLIYSCMELATNKDIEDNRRHMINIFESAISLMKPGSNVESWAVELLYYIWTLFCVMFFIPGSSSLTSLIPLLLAVDLGLLWILY